jgi:hypothetical protein
MVLGFILINLLDRLKIFELGQFVDASLFGEVEHVRVESRFWSESSSGRV